MSRNINADEADINATVPMSTLTAALDEIYNLRLLLAYGASSQEVDLGYASFPKSRRASAKMSVELMRAGARGDGVQAEVLAMGSVLGNAMGRAGGSRSLTKSEWEAQRGIGG